MDFRWPPPPDGRPDRPRAPLARGPHAGRPAPTSAPTELVSTPHGVSLECMTTGSGEPVTVFAHGLGQGISEARPLGSGVAGQKVFFQFRGHGTSDAPAGRWTYGDLARDLRAVADLHGATRALGISLGAGALCRLLAANPGRFERLVFFLPAVLDRPRGPVALQRLAALREAIDSGEATAVAEVVALEVPEALRTSPAVWAYLRRRVEQLLRDGLSAGLTALPTQVAVPDRAALAAVTVPALVIGCRGDDLHPAEVAEELAALLPRASLHVYDRPGVLWTERADLRERVAGFLNAR
jgi:3-oxoadipate enol-lactonase